MRVCGGSSGSGGSSSSNDIGGGGGGGGVMEQDIGAKTTKKSCCSASVRCAGVGCVGRAVERVCEAWGRVVAGYPCVAVVVVVVMAAAASLGFLNLHTEWRHYYLWVPHDSLFAKVNSWKLQHFNKEPRSHFVLWTSRSEDGSVLRADAIQDMWSLHERVKNLSVRVGNQDVTWDDVCLKVPCPLPPGSNQTHQYQVDRSALLKALTVPTSSLLAHLQDTLCSQIEAWPTRCLEKSLLEIWDNDGSRISNLTNEQVIWDVNQVTAKRYHYLLGGVERNGSGHITSAGSALHVWTTKVQTNDHMILDLATGQKVQLAGVKWEEAMVGEVEAMAGSNGSVRPMVRAAHSLDKIATDAATGDLKWVAMGSVMVIVYVMLTLPRPVLILVTIVIAMPLTLIASYGLCAAFAVPFSFLNAMLPVLVIGLGIDDMYVLAAAWEAEGHNAKVDVRVRGGRALGRVGAAITLTSLTDVLAFLVGATTRLSGLRWFCLYAAAGITCVFFLHVTLFVAAISVYERRFTSSASRCGPPLASVVQRAMVPYSAFILRRGVAPVVMVGALALVGVSLWGAVSLNRQFILMEWLLPPSSDLHKMMKEHQRQFPRQGEYSYIYFANVTLPDDLPGLYDLAMALQESPYVESVTGWFLTFMSLLPSTNMTLTSLQFHQALTLFMFSPFGAKYNYDMEFSGPLRCRHSAPPLSAFRINMQHQVLYTMEEQSAALREVRRLLSEARVSGFRGAWADAYSQWETGGMIGEEVGRGLSMVVVMVGVATLVVVGVGTVAMIVVGCVLSTLLQVMAIMHLSGLTVNTVTAIALVLASGLSVDYAAHIAHAFMIAKGTRKERAGSALVSMGPSVLHAGVSTLLAFAALGPSSTYLFIAYFKILTSVAALSLLQSMVVLPVVLSLIGPQTSQQDTPQKGNKTSTPVQTTPPTMPATPVNATPVQIKAITPIQTTPPTMPATPVNATPVQIKAITPVQTTPPTTPATPVFSNTTPAQTTTNTPVQTNPPITPVHSTPPTPPTPVHNAHLDTTPATPVQSKPDKATHLYTNTKPATPTQNTPVSSSTTSATPVQNTTKTRLNQTC